MLLAPVAVKPNISVNIIADADTDISTLATTTAMPGVPSLRIGLPGLKVMIDPLDEYVAAPLELGDRFYLIGQTSWQLQQLHLGGQSTDNGGDGHNQYQNQGQDLDSGLEPGSGSGRNWNREQDRGRGSGQQDQLRPGRDQRTSFPKGRGQVNGVHGEEDRRQYESPDRDGGEGE
ncbi:hypothetical protein GMORB2_3824 [Geosmithia morbida]|uniref:Uncharacterized protein n=1 Tax=Geosmithia morbida TaxID=1094350 RepID=A0A9P5D6P8_9HYPO|nr:uncharacterized protein GMORB2_3824 [Geosmithia morbida]KAF4124985.1 hypothetical protein GMORB2_3824 [Geosmithia morbida]